MLAFYLYFCSFINKLLVLRPNIILGDPIKSSLLLETVTLTYFCLDDSDMLVIATPSSHLNTHGGDVHPYYNHTMHKHQCSHLYCILNCFR